MAIISIDEAKANRLGYELSHIYALLLTNTTMFVNQTLDELEEKGLINTDYRGYKVITPSGKEFLKIYLSNSNPDARDSNALMNIAKMLQELYPKGLKPGTNTPWRGSAAEVAQRLNRFFIKYPEYTIAQVVDATKRYVESFNGDYSYMRALKYFISKRLKGLPVNQRKRVHYTL